MNILRTALLLTCLVFFLNGCNSFISGLAGTHKLRTFTMQEMVMNGVGDADHIELTEAFIPDKYLHIPGKGRSSGVLFFPVLDADQMVQMKRGEPVKPVLIAWIKDAPSDCIEKGNCIQTGLQTVKGLVLKPKRYEEHIQELFKEESLIKNNLAVVIELDKSPLAWFWSLAMMAGAFVIAFCVEFLNKKKERFPK